MRTYLGSIDNTMGKATEQWENGVDVECYLLVLLLVEQTYEASTPNPNPAIAPVIANIVLSCFIVCLFTRYLDLTNSMVCDGGKVPFLSRSRFFNQTLKPNTFKGEIKNRRTFKEKRE